MKKPLVGISIMPEPHFLKAIYPLMEDGLIDTIEWSFDTLSNNNQPDFLTLLLDAYSSEERLIGHGVYYSLFDAQWSKRQEEWLIQLKKELINRKYNHITEHFGYMSSPNFHKGFPLPVSLNNTTLHLGIDRIKRLQDASQLPIGIENLAFSFSKNDVLKQGEFIAKLIDSVDGFILLDLHNLYCQAHNFEIEMDELVKCYPLEKIKEIHLSGGSWQENIYKPSKKIRRDTHDKNVPSILLAYLPQIIAQCNYLEYVILEKLGNSFLNENDFLDYQTDFKAIKKIIEDSSSVFEKRR